MKALDTNVLIRFLVRDDPARAAKVDQLFDEAQERGRSFLVTLPVVLEIIWVLRTGYMIPRTDILDTLEKLTMMPIITFDPACPIHELVEIARNSSLDLPDIAIGLSARNAGCETTLTLDRKAAQSELFQEIQ